MRNAPFELTFPKKNGTNVTTPASINSFTFAATGRISACST
eukprot:CAMPEP_0171095078 /NCGR_PEP_ID=MMETSP0766_2-20121228/42975_1 /TAXON_ID=439317 /ORGANISM="Gambierdiscus australes, Strain CAWD 149" /LENGTH=40 /DNA_ID= /DNA_START= /DNA_END= /DNA_ORIENTATION=